MIEILTPPRVVCAAIEDPIFVVGCCNSGTTILWQALRSHPDVDGPAVEGQDLAGLPRCMTHSLGRQTFRMFAHPRFREIYRLTEKDLHWPEAVRLASVYREHCAIGKRLIEKSPANTVRVRYLQAVFPQASFVFIVRDAIAVSEGIVRKRRFDPDRPQKSGQDTTLPDAALQWLYANRSFLGDQPFLRCSTVVRYEDLVRTPETVLASLLKFCGLRPAALSYPQFTGDLNRVQISRLPPQQIRELASITSGLRRCDPRRTRRA